LHAIIEENGGTRGYGETTSSPTDPVESGPLGNIKALKEAYRADPSKTLELIKNNPLRIGDELPHEPIFFEGA